MFSTFLGPGLVFVVFPTAISKMPFPHLWSVLFFLTLLTVAFDSEVGCENCCFYMITYSIVPTMKMVHVSSKHFSLNSLPNDNILGLPKSKAFADNKIKVTENLKFVL